MRLRWLKYLFLLLLVIFIGFSIYAYNYAMARLAPRPSMKDTPTTFIGFNHIGISVLDLDKMVDFYQSATGFEVISRYSIDNDPGARVLFSLDSISYETAILKGPNMLLELTEFKNQKDTVIDRMPFYGPGMTHTCFQGPVDKPVYKKFKNAGVDIISRGGMPVGESSIRVSYAYGYDPEGNMVELEQMPDILISMHIGKKWSDQNPVWMTQVAIMTHDLKRLTDYYEGVLGINPYRENSYGPHPSLDAIVDFDSVMIEASWFGMDTQGKKMELMQYTNPITPESTHSRLLTDLGYSFSFEVGDIHKEYNRLKSQGVNFKSAPQKMKNFWMVFAQDPDGNVYSLRQIIDENSPLSLKNM